MDYLGKHLIIELYNCGGALLSDSKQIEIIMQETALAMGATIVQSNFHHFTPLGVSGVVIIKESHLTIHTWPEHGYAAVDVFTCGEIQFEKGIHFLKEKFQTEEVEVKVLERGEQRRFNSLKPEAS